MTTPQDPGAQDPFATPQPGSSPDPNQPPPPPAYGQPQPPPAYGAPPPAYGQAQYGAPYGGPPMTVGTNGFAIASLICAFLCWPLGLIFGFIAKSQIKQRGQGGDGLATAGIIISFIWLALVIILSATGNVTFSSN
jgi:hypothetical protein